MRLTPQKYVYIRTFGCQMNEHDSDKIVHLLSSCGFSRTDNISSADLILFNTCTIREKANQKAMSEIGRSLKHKEARPETLIGVCGCVAQEAREEIFSRFPYVDLLFGPDQLHKLPELIQKAKLKQKASSFDLINDQNEYIFLDGSASKDVSAFVSIMKGCNSACSYCIVPSVRGREVCRPYIKIIDEIRKLSSAGVKEVVLLGQNVNSYEHNETSFAKLIQKIADETDIQRIRFVSPHPKDVKDDLVAEYRSNGKLMPHIHLPVQSGSNEMLRKMRRGYTREHYLEVVKKLKETNSNFSITTDIIVAFCGETRKDFEDTINLMNEIEFDSSFAFKYSPRRGTEAERKFEDDVPQEEKEKRLDQVLKLQVELSLRKNLKLVNSTTKTLVIGFDKMKKGFLTGRFPDNRIVHFAGDSDLIGQIVSVKVVRANANSLQGELVQ